MLGGMAKSRCSHSKLLKTFMRFLCVVCDCGGQCSWVGYEKFGIKEDLWPTKHQHMNKDNFNYSCTI